MMVYDNWPIDPVMQLRDVADRVTVLLDHYDESVGRVTAVVVEGVARDLEEGGDGKSS